VAACLLLVLQLSPNLAAVNYSSSNGQVVPAAAKGSISSKMAA
jgi:hypothetical protein